MGSVCSCCFNKEKSDVNNPSLQEGLLSNEVDEDIPDPVSRGIASSWSSLPSSKASPEPPRKMSSLDMDDYFHDEPSPYSLKETSEMDDLSFQDNKLLEDRESHNGWMEQSTDGMPARRASIQNLPREASYSQRRSSSMDETKYSKRDSNYSQSSSLSLVDSYTSAKSYLERLTSQFSESEAEGPSRTFSLRQDSEEKEESNDENDGENKKGSSVSSLEADEAQEYPPLKKKTSFVNSDTFHQTTQE